MKFEFQNWALIQQAEEPDRQYDHLWGTLTVTGAPEGYNWAMLVQAGRFFDKWPLSPVEGGVGTVLTKDMLSVDGRYNMQLEGTSTADGQTVRHSNVIQVYVPHSLSADARWPSLPMEFTLAEKRILEAKNEAAQSALNAGKSAEAAAQDAATAMAAKKAAGTSAQSAALSESNAQSYAGQAASEAGKAAASAKEAKEAASKLQIDATLTKAGIAADAAATGKAVNDFITRLTSGSIGDAELHLGFYLDADGDLCQKEE